MLYKSFELVLHASCVKCANFNGISRDSANFSLRFTATSVDAGALNQLVNSCMKGLEDYNIFHFEMCFKYPVTLNSSLENVELPGSFLF